MRVADTPPSCRIGMKWGRARRSTPVRTGGTHPSGCRCPSGGPTRPRPRSTAWPPSSSPPTPSSRPSRRATSCSSTGGRRGAARAASSRRPTRSRATSTTTSSSARSTPRPSRPSPVPPRSPRSRRSWASARASSSSASRGALPPAGLEQVIEGIKALDMDDVRAQVAGAGRGDAAGQTERLTRPRPDTARGILAASSTDRRRPAHGARPRRDAGRRQAAQARPGPDRRRAEDDRGRPRLPGHRHPAGGGLQGARPGRVRGHRARPAAVLADPEAQEMDVAAMEKLFLSLA